MDDHLVTDSLGRDYPRLLDLLYTKGSEVDTRGGRTREIVDFSLVLRDPARCLVDRVGISRRFMDAEIAMLLAGTYDAELLRAITPKAADLITPLTAYGPRVRHQLPLIVQELRRDPVSRRAVVYVGNEADLARIGEETANEMPCTMTWQFLLRNEELHMIVNMRSWDAVWGLTYDVPCFVAVQMAVARALGVEVGDYMHHAGSLHLYERHWNIEAHPTDALLEIPYLCEQIEETALAAKAMVDIWNAGRVLRLAKEVMI